MLKVGIVDLDTSHPGRWVPILQEWETVDVVACWDAGALHPAGYAQEFAQEHQIPCVPETLDEMVEMVDVAFVQSSNWDVHLKRAAPFVQASKGVYIDKPIAGNLRDLLTLREWVKGGANIIGGSSLRCCDEVEAIRAGIGDGDVVSVYAIGPNDYFNYGIHTIELAQAVLGDGVQVGDVQTVTHLGKYYAERLRLTYGSGLEVILELCSPARKFFLSVTATNGHWSAAIESDFYRALLRRIVAHFTEQEPFPADIHLLSRAVEVLLAGRESARMGKPVFLDELSLDERGFDGDAFNEAYRISRMGR